MAEAFLHLGKDFFAFGVVGGARVNDVSIVNEHKANKGDYITADGRPHFDSIASRLHGVDDASSHSSPTSSSSSIPLVEALLGGFVGEVVVGFFRVTVGSSDVVAEVLNGIDHGLDGGFWGTKTEEAEESDGVHYPIITTFGIVGDNDGSFSFEP